MNIRKSESARLWKSLVLLIAVVWLAGCKVQTQGLVDLRDADGESYSFSGATVSLFPLNAAAVTPGQSAMPLATATVAPEGGAVKLATPFYQLWNNRFYVVEFRCPADVPEDDCEVAEPLRVVLTGAMLRAGGWRATVLTETAFHAVAYGAMARYTPEEIQQLLDHTAQVLLEGSYLDLLAWNTTDTDALTRPGSVVPLSAALADGIEHNELKRLMQQWVSTAQIGYVAVSSSGLADDPVVEDGYAYLAGSNGLEIIDVRDPHRPVRVSQLSLGSFREVQQTVLQDGFLYITVQSQILRPSVLLVADVRDPLHPVIVRQHGFSTEARQFTVAGDYLYLVGSTSSPSWRHELIILDIRNPEQLYEMANLRMERGASQFVMSGQHLYLGDSTGLTIVDVSNPALPVVRGVWGTLPVYSDMAASDDKIYMNGTQGDLVVVDVSDPLEPTIISSMEMEWLHGSGDRARSIYVMGTDVYLISGSAVHRIDASDPAQLRWTGALQAPNVHAYGLAVQQGFAYIRGFAGGMYILGLDSLQGAPALAGSLDMPAGVSAATKANARTAYAPMYNLGVGIIDLSRPRAPALLRVDRRFRNVLEMAFAGQHAFFGDSYFFYALDITNPRNPIELPGTISLQERGYQVAESVQFVGDYAYVSARDDWEASYLVVMDLQNPQVPVLTSQVIMPNFMMTIAAADDRAYAITYTDEQLLHVIDIQHRTLPQVGGSIALPMLLRDAAAAGDYLYLACGDAGLLVVDASDPGQPALVATIPTAGFANSITLADGYAFVADSVSGITLLDLTNPAMPMIVGSAIVRGIAVGSFVHNGYLYAGTNMSLDVFKKLRAAVGSD